MGKFHIKYLILFLTAYLFMSCQKADEIILPSVTDTETMGQNQDTEQKESQTTMKLKVNDEILTVKLAENVATTALVNQLKKGPVTYKADDYGGFEKVGGLGFSLPTANTHITTQPGDVMLYLGNQLCIFLDKNSWEYTRIGTIEGLSEDQLKSALGNGTVSITLSLE